MATPYVINKRDVIARDNYYNERAYSAIYK